MPDEATVRDVARKLEVWAASLDSAERTEVEDWMALGARPGRSTPGTVWWFEPSTHGGKPSTREVD